jgi:hypothetical protein
MGKKFLLHPLVVRYSVFMFGLAVMGWCGSMGHIANRITKDVRINHWDVVVNHWSAHHSCILCHW